MKSYSNSKRIMILNLLIPLIMTACCILLISSSSMAASQGSEILHNENGTKATGYGIIEESPKSRVGYYLTVYQPVDPKTDPLVKRTYKIFRRVKGVADKRGKRMPHLKVVTSDGDPWAIALPDGYIVLSKRAVEICFQNVSQAEGDARMAFVIGHELGHMAEDDFWHLETYMALAGEPKYEQLRKNLEGQDVSNAERQTRFSAARTKEMKADADGFLYAAMAGYQVDELLGEEKGKQDFFTYFMSQIPHSIDSKHPTPAQRANFLRNRLQILTDKIDFFKFGVRLAHFQKYEDAIFFFNEFAKVFPSRETMNNLGYCYLQKAINQLPPPIAYKYWLPLEIDPFTKAETLTLKGAKGSDAELPDEAKISLEDAVVYFKKACEADELYIPSRINLAIAYFYLGKNYKARGIVEEGLEIESDNLDLIVLKALVLNRQGKDGSTWEQAVSILKEIAKRQNASLSVLYNLAVLYEQKGRFGKAQNYWSALAEQIGGIPPSYRHEIARRVKLPEPKKIADKKEVKLPWKLPIEIGFDLIENKDKRKMFAGWRDIPFNWQIEGKLENHIYRDSSGTSVLELDGFVEMVVLVNGNFGTVEKLQKHFSNGLIEKEIVNGKLLTYENKWAVLSQDNKIMEVWVSQN